MIKVLDHGFVRHIESWGHGEAGDGRAKDASIGPDEGDDMECGIIEAARQSTQGNFRGWEQDEKLLRTLYLNEPQHATPFEFAGCVIEVRAPIFVFREWHRHRIQSYEECTFDSIDDTAFNEMSARYAPLPDINYLPSVERCMKNSKTNRQAGTLEGADELTEANCLTWLNRVDYFYGLFETVYQDGLKIGIPKELARIGMPVGRYSQMRAQTSLRNWLAFMTLRHDPAAQWEIQQFAAAVGTILEREFPHTYALYVEKKSPEHRIKKFTDDELLAEFRRRPSLIDKLNMEETL